MRTGEYKDIVIGVLAFQGAFVEHMRIVKSLNYSAFEVRKLDDLDKIDGLIIPGGESTTMKYHLNFLGFGEKLKEKINNGFPVYGTCAGAILLAKTIDGKFNKQGLDVMNIDISRNAYGSQLDSFEEEITISLKDGDYKIPAIYIRAPKINFVGDRVDILGKNGNGEIVMVRQNNMLATTFHPELTNNTLIHSYFIKDIIQNS